MNLRVLSSSQSLLPGLDTEDVVYGDDIDTGDTLVGELLVAGDVLGDLGRAGSCEGVSNVQNGAVRRGRLMTWISDGDGESEWGFRKRRWN